MDVTHTDGSPLYVDDLDQPNQQRVRELLEKAWSCRLMTFGKLAIVDFFALQHERICGIVEIKGARKPSTRYGTALLSVRKYDALLRHQICFGVPGIFVADFTDGVWFIRVGDIDHTRYSLKGRRDRDSLTDIEPLIDVPVEAMTAVRTG
jgi:hypothetical protein